MNCPKNLRYAKSHEWVEVQDGVATVGLSDYAQGELGDLVFVNLPETGDEVTAGEPFADVESVKAVSDIYSPVSGVVLEVNEELLDSPETINSNPYGAWFVKVGSIEAEAELLDSTAYETYVEEKV